MIRRSSFRLFAVIALLVLPQLCSAAPIEAIPDDALVVFRFRAPKGLVKKATTVVTKLDKDYVEPFEGLTKRIWEHVGNSNLEGVDPAGEWWVALIEGSSGEAAAVYGIPFKDKEDKLKSAVTGGYQFVKHEKFLFYTLDSGASQKIQERVNKEGKSIATVIDRASMQILTKSDAAMFVNIKQLAKKHKPQLDAVSDELNKSLANWKKLAPPVAGMDLAPAFQMYGEAAKTLLQAVKDCNGYAVGVEISVKGATIEQYLKLEASSPTDKLLQTQKTSDLKDVEKLPADQLVYAGMHGDFAAITKWAYKFAAEMMKDEAARNALREVADEQAKMKYGAYLMSFNLGDVKEGALRTTVVTVAQPPDKLRDVTRKTATLLPAISAGPVKQKVELKADAEKFGSHSADLITIHTELDKSKMSPAGIAAIEKSTAAMYGPDGMVERIVYMGDRVMMTSGGGKSAMQAAITSHERTHSTSEAAASPFSATRKQLADKANLIVLADVAGLVVGYAKVLDQIAKGTDGQSPQNSGPLDTLIGSVKDLEAKPSYLGTSVTIGVGSVASTTFIPIEQAEGVNAIFKAVREIDIIKAFLPF